MTDVLAFSAVGSLREDLPPGTFVLVDQFVDLTYSRVKSFFGTGCAAHVSMARPVCARLGDSVEAGAKDAGVRLVRGGTYVVMEGPQFSTRAESEIYRSWGCCVVGMTNMPEAKLAREAELCYATIAMVTDYDCWHQEHGVVDVASVMQVAKDNAHRVNALLARILADFPAEHEPCPVGSDRALEGAIMTHPEARDPDLMRKLDAVAGRVLGARS